MVLKKSESARLYGVQVSQPPAIFILGNRMRFLNYLIVSAALAESITEMNPAAVDDLAILVPEESAGAGIPEQIVKLYDELRPSLHAYLSWLGINWDQAEDVIQDTFLRLVASRWQPDGGVNLRAWVFRVAHNLSMDVHRFQRRWSWNSNHEVNRLMRQRRDPRPSPEELAILRERRRRVEHAFAQLTPRQRDCILLRAEGFRYREIARILGISVQRVGELMQRSLTLLEVHT